jgi:dTDP-4-dehydrorhamnose reductase
MKILFFGSRGWIGKQFGDYLNSHGITYISTDVRADDEKAVEEEIKLYSPTHIISFIGRTHGGEYNTIDYLELPGKLKDNLRDNLYSPVILSILCERYDIHYTYLGTGCIFSSDDPTTTSIDDDEKPDFFGSSYSIVKGFTDRLQHLYSKNTLNLRIRMPIVNFQHDRNFLSKIFKYSKICSMPNSMTVLEDMFPVIMDMIQNKTTGTFNLVNKGLITHNEILEMYKEHIDKGFTWENFNVEEQNAILLSKRSNTQLSTDKLYSLYPDIPDIKTSVEKCITGYHRKL